MKTVRIFTSILFLFHISAFGQDSTGRWLQELNGNFDLVRAVTRTPTRLWRFSPAVAFRVKNNFYLGAEFPIISLNTRSTSSRTVMIGSAPGGQYIEVETAKSTNMGISLFVRKHIPLNQRFLSFLQLGFGYHVFKGEAFGTRSERFSQRWTGFAPNARVGLVYKLNERYWLNTNVHYSTASRLNIFVQRRPNMVSLQFGVTFLPRF